MPRARVVKAAPKKAASPRRKRADPAAVSARAAAVAVARALDLVRAESIVVLDVGETSPVAEVFLLANGSAARHVQALAAEAEAALKPLGIRPLRREGVEQGWWAVLDYGPLLVHIFQPDARAYYDLEMLWGDARKVRWRPAARKKA